MSCQILVPLLRLHVLSWKQRPNYCWALPVSYSSSKVWQHNNHQAFQNAWWSWGLLCWGLKPLSEFSSRVQHPLSETQAFFKYFQLVEEVASDVSPWVTVLKILSSRRGGSSAAGIGINLPSVGMVLSSQWGQSDSSQLLKRSHTIARPLSPSYPACTHPRGPFWFVNSGFLEHSWWLPGCKCFSWCKEVTYLM